MPASKSSESQIVGILANANRQNEEVSRRAPSRRADASGGAKADPCLASARRLGVKTALNPSA